MQPTLVLIPGLWHGPECFAALRSQLEPKYDTVTDKMPSVGAADPTKIGLQNDIEHVRNRLLLPLLEQNKDIVLVMHSYAGIPGAAAVEGLDEESRGPGKGAVLGLIYLSANVIPEEINQMEAWEEAEPGYSFKYISLPEDVGSTSGPTDRHPPPSGSSTANYPSAVRCLTHSSSSKQPWNICTTTCLRARPRDGRGICRRHRPVWR